MFIAIWEHKWKKFKYQKEVLLILFGSLGGKPQLLETFKNSSIITWQHINFHGEYDFSEEKTRDSIGFNLPKILSWKLDENGK